MFAATGGIQSLERTLNGLIRNGLAPLPLVRVELPCLQRRNGRAVGRETSAGFRGSRTQAVGWGLMSAIAHAPPDVRR